MFNKDMNHTFFVIAKNEMKKGHIASYFALLL